MANNTAMKTSQPIHGGVNPNLLPVQSGQLCPSSGENYDCVIWGPKKIATASEYHEMPYGEPIHFTRYLKHTFCRRSEPGALIAVSLLRLQGLRHLDSASGNPLR